MVDSPRPPSRAQQHHVHNHSVSDYYSNTLWDYLLAWTDQKNLALHFGYRDGAQLGHTASLSYANKVLADTIAIKPGERVLDAGSGLGGSSFWLVKHRGAITTGIALGVDQVALARQEASRRGLSQECRFLVSDFQCLPFPDKSFDVVWAQESLCHAPAKSDFFKETYRVLRPGGRIVVSDFFLRSQKILDSSNRIVLKEWLDAWKIPFLWTAAQHSNAAKSAGFVNVSISDVTRCTFRSHLRLYRMASLVLPLAIVLGHAGARNSIQHGNVIAALRQYQALRSNIWFYAILSAHK
jgi:ubiquinone/menaquinone biosynthesis C-methylase UbiE